MSVKVSITPALEMALTKIRAMEELSWPESCDRAALLILNEEEERSREVKRRAERIFSSRFMVQLNKSRKTFYNKGFTEGYKRGRADFEIWYYCSRCGGMMTMRPGGSDHEALIGYMKEHGWHHTRCPE